MTAEDDIVEELKSYQRIIQENKKTLEENKKTLEEKTRALEEKTRVLEEKNQVIKNAILQMRRSGLSIDQIAVALSIPKEDVEREMGAPDK